MSQRIATLIVRSVALAVFVIVVVTYAALAYKTAEPQMPLLAFASLGMGRIAAWAAFAIGKLITHPRTSEEAVFWFSRQPYMRVVRSTSCACNSN